MTIPLKREELYQKRREHLELLKNYGMCGVLAHDTDGNVVVCNERLATDLGYTTHELCKLHIRDITENFVQFYFNEIISYLIVAGFDIEKTRYKCKDGKYLDVKLYIYTLDLGDQILIVDFIIDENEQNEALTNAQLQNQDALSKLAGGLAHDFNNMLTIMMGHASLLEMFPDDIETVKKSTKNIIQGCRSASNLVRQLAAFSRGGAPLLTIASIKQIISETVSFCLSGSRIKPIIDVPDDLWNCRVDKHQISQVIQNLVVNAREAMHDDGEIVITCRNKPDFQVPGTVISKRDWVEIVVSDTGPGIKPEMLETIFQPYVTTKSKGQGLGLAIVYAVIIHHSGHIHCFNSISKGAKFVIHLPAAPSTEKLKESEYDASKQKIMYKILLLEHNEQIRDLFVNILTKMNHDVHSVYSGDQAIASFDKAILDGKPYNIVILDTIVPGSTGGIEALRQMKQISLNVKAIATSTIPDDPVVREPTSFGFAAVLLKPFNLDDIQNVLNRLG